MTLTLRQLHYFEVLAGVLHFRRAAAELNVSQPALSAQIAELETQLGARLFDRGRGGVRLTRDGELLRLRAARILNEVRDLEAFAAERRGVLARELRLGVIPTLAPYLLPGFLAELRRDFPEARISLQEALTQELLDGLKLGSLDVLLLALPIEDGSVQVLPLFDDPFVVAVGDDDQELQAPVAQASLRPERLLLLNEGHCLRDQALNACAAEGGPRSRFGAASLSTLVQMVAHGMGYTLIPAMALESEASDPRIRVLPFAEPVPVRTVGLAWRRGSYREADFEVLADLFRRVRLASEA